MSALDSSPGATGEESLSPLEQEVLDEYVRLAGNLEDVREKRQFTVKQIADVQKAVVSPQ